MFPSAIVHSGILSGRPSRPFIGLGYAVTAPLVSWGPHRSVVFYSKQTVSSIYEPSVPGQYEDRMTGLQARGWRARWRRAYFWILPVAVFGKGPKMTVRGTL